MKVMKLDEINIDYNANLRILINTLLDDKKSSVKFETKEFETHNELELRIQFIKQNKCFPKTIIPNK